LDEDWLMDDGDYERVVQNRLDELLRPGAGPAANLGQQATVDVTNQLADCIARHADAGSGAGDKQPKADRPYPWPPTPEHRAALLAILAQQSRS
jgi:hypothetical protein